MTAIPNYSGRQGFRLGSFWKKADVDRLYHAQEPGFRTGVGADGKEYMCVEFEALTSATDGDVLYWTDVAAGKVSNRSSGSTGMVAGCLVIPSGVSAPVTDDQGFIQIKGVCRMRKATALAVAAGNAATATSDGTVTVAGSDHYDDANDNVAFASAASDETMTVAASSNPDNANITGLMVGRVAETVAANASDEVDVLLTLEWA